MNRPVLLRLVPSDRRDLAMRSDDDSGAWLSVLVRGLTSADQFRLLDGLRISQTEDQPATS